IELSLTNGARDEAMTHLRNLAARPELNPELLSQLANAYFRLGQSDAAAELVQRIRSSGQPLPPLALRVLGLSLWNRSEYPGAVEHLDRVEPDAEVLRALIDSYLHIGQFRSAKHQTDRAKDVEESSPALDQLTRSVTALADRHDNLVKAFPKIDEEAWDGLLC